MKNLARIIPIIGLILISCMSMAQSTLVDVTKTYPNIKTIEVNSGWLDVTYTGAIGTEVKVEALLQSTDTNQDIVFITVGDVLKITHKKTGSGSSWSKFNKGYIKITGPESIKLNLVSTSGTVNLTQIAADKTFIKMTSGQTNAQKIKGDLSIKSTSGTIYLDDIIGNIDSELTSGQFNAQIIKGNISIKSTSGTIVLDDIAGNINAQLTSGKAKIMNVKGNVDYNSTSGSLNAMDVTGELNAGLTSGNVRVQNIQSLGNIRFTSGSFRAENSGLGPKTYFSGTSGSFRLQTSSNLKSFNYSLQASSGSLKVGDIYKSKSLEINNGSSTWIKGSIYSGSISIEN